MQRSNTPFLAACIVNLAK